MDSNLAPCGLLSLNTSGNVMSMNATLSRWLGLSEDQTTGQPFVNLLTTPSRIFYLGHILPLLQQTGHTEENYLSFKHAKTGDIPVLVNACKATQNGQDIFVMAVVTMQRRHIVEEQLLLAKQRAEEAMNEREKAYEALEETKQELEEKQQLLTQINAKLEALSTKDPLTGLNNRRVYERELETRLLAIKRDRMPFSVLVLDLDFFKNVNDKFGHDKGDLVLQELARLLTEELREIDVLVRMGGEEFVVVLPNTPQTHALEVAERIRARVAQHAFVTGTLTLSVGVAEATETDTKASLYERADRALYRAKQLGRNRIEFVAA